MRINLDTGKSPVPENKDVGVMDRPLGRLIFRSYVQTPSLLTCLLVLQTFGKFSSPPSLPGISRVYDRFIVSPLRDLR